MLCQLIVGQIFDGLGTDCEGAGQVRSAYLELSERVPGWQIIPLLDGDRLRSVQEVADRVWDAVAPRLPRR